MSRRQSKVSFLFAPLHLAFSDLTISSSWPCPLLPKWQSLVGRVIWKYIYLGENVQVGESHEISGISFEAEGKYQGIVAGLCLVKCFVN